MHGVNRSERVLPRITLALGADIYIPWFGMEAREFFCLLLGTDAEEVVINPFDPIRRRFAPADV